MQNTLERLYKTVGLTVVIVFCALAVLILGLGIQALFDLVVQGV